MLGFLYNGTNYPVVEAAELYAQCQAQGIDTSWWEEIANTVTLRSGLGPSEAYLLLPYGYVKLLDPPTGFGNVAGLHISQTGDNDDTGGGVCPYDHILWFPQLIYRNSLGALITRGTDAYLAGWSFAESRAIDSQRDPTNNATVHLVKLVDMRGFSQSVAGPRSTQIYKIGKKSTEESKDFWGFPAPDATSYWPGIADELWFDLSRNYSPTRFSTFFDNFDYPVFADMVIPASGDDPEYTLWGNNRPHNLLFKEMSSWEAFVAYANKISHEVYPEAPAKYTTAIGADAIYYITAIDDHTVESTTWITLLDPDRGLKLQMGQELYSRISWLIDHDHPPREVVIPHGFTAVFSKTTGTVETALAIPPYALWRGFGISEDYDNKIPILSGSLFSQELVKDTSAFPPQFLVDHPVTLAGDLPGTFGTDRAARSHTQYIDCTFFAVPTNDSEPDSLDIDHATDKLRTTADADTYPAPDIARVIANRHLRMQMFGDLGTVVLSGLHGFGPGPRHDTVIFDAGINGPRTILIGHYDPNKWCPFPRKITGQQKPLVVAYTAAISDSIGAGSAATPTQGLALIYQLADDGSTTLHKPTTDSVVDADDIPEDQEGAGDPDQQDELPLLNPFNMAACGSCTCIPLNEAASVFIITGPPLTLGTVVTSVSCDSYVTDSTFAKPDVCAESLPVDADA